MNRSSNKKEKWLSAHLFYAEPWEEFLKYSVSPFTENVINNGLAKQYFFIRYWENGPHIRLRCYGEENILDEKLKPYLITYFENFFNKCPSNYSKEEQLRNINDNDKWYPNNSIQFIEYVPETERYGGPNGIIISEEMFLYSSDTVLNILKENETWDEETALAAGIQLHLAFCHSFGMNFEEATVFFQNLCDMWYLAVIDTSKVNSKDELLRRKADLIQNFENNYQKHNENLKNYINILIEGFQSNCEFESMWFSQWLNKTNTICQKLQSAIAEDKIGFQIGTRDLYKSSSEYKRQGLWDILYSYIHMTNNRLGIVNQDEAYLAYLIKRSIEDLSQKIKTFERI